MRVSVEPGRERGDAVVVRIRDRGTPLQGGDFGRVFEPFFFDRSAGLGLPIAQGIVQGHGGTIAARNVEDGVEIAVMLPGDASTKAEPR